MPMFDEEPVKKKVSHEVGQDLSALSLHELDERIALLEAEVARLAAAKAAKAASMDAAASIFRKI
ncbi:DUF1192 domain-containing protein [Labrys wisconsinensis]|uniref:Uncharacterized small protein (DUF1192 family) n=1 Tax=Labrys wisconsinensis TaxID=425677 RepID=A0ABU0JA50_9HYPH|nr:DUF1192 domain-containing protein [Labrys wisconsinensis]MDQ0471140.1 uncharacterized small protein (DUF1192 family) [Labrys wisconsinensis]